MYRICKENGAVLRIADNAFIPDDEQNGDWLEYQSWLNQGNIPSEIDLSTAQVPQEVSRFQGRAALIQGGYMAAIQAYIDQPTTDIMVKEAWANVTVFRRQSPMMQTVAQVLGLSEEDLDNLFIAAHAIGDV
jgi:hypothetical protein